MAINLPASADVLVVGAGATGLSVALSVLSRGHHSPSSTISRKVITFLVLQSFIAEHWRSSLHME
jgi:glycine/D-amino acid oxidase-like deaminating enzyme